jgi:hypothetical protein
MINLFLTTYKWIELGFSMKKTALNRLIENIKNEKINLLMFDDQFCEIYNDFKSKIIYVENTIKLIDENDNTLNKLKNMINEEYDDFKLKNNFESKIINIFKIKNIHKIYYYNDNHLSIKMDFLEEMARNKEDNIHVVLSHKNKLKNKLDYKNLKFHADLGSFLKSIEDITGIAFVDKEEIEEYLNIEENSIKKDIENNVNININIENYNFDIIHDSIEIEFKNIDIQNIEHMENFSLQALISIIIHGYAIAEKTNKKGKFISEVEFEKEIETEVRITISLDHEIFQPIKYYIDWIGDGNSFSEEYDFYFEENDEI